VRKDLGELFRWFHESERLAGRLLRLAAMGARSAAECTDRSVPLGRYWRTSPLVFSFDPRCQEEWGSQKYKGMPVAMVKSAWYDISLPESRPPPSTETKLSEEYMSGTHIGIIGHSASPGLGLTVELKRILSDISSSQAFRPLVLHHGYNGGSDDVAIAYVRELEGWHVESHPGRAADVAEASHILIAITQGGETAQSDVLTLANRAQASGRKIIRIRLVMSKVKASPKPAPKAPGTAKPKPAIPKQRAIPASRPAPSAIWAREHGQADLRSGQVCAKYRVFRARHNLPDDKNSLQLWNVYHSVTRSALPQKPPKAKRDAPKKRPKVTGRAFLVTGTAPGTPQRRSAGLSKPILPTNSMTAVPLTDRTAELLRRVNPPLEND
jgi:hypothetical protein